MNQRLPSAETPIALQNPASAAAAKETHAKLRKRPEDDLVPDSAAPAAPDQQAAPGDDQAAGSDGQATGQDLVLAQAAQAGGAAEGTASAGGGSAAAGAGAPVAAVGGGLGMGALAIGAGGLAVAAAAAGGGGGGGAGSTATPTPMPGSTPAPTPTPTPTPAPVMVHGFSDYVAAVNQSGASAATTAIATGIPPGETTPVVDISGGFARGALPKTLAELRPMNYNVSGANVTSINDGGIVADQQGQAVSTVIAHSDATAGTSNLMWMQTLAVRNFTAGTAGAPTVSTASANASGAGSDAEIGVQHLSMDATRAGAAAGQTNLAATATDGGAAHAFAGDVHLNINSTGTGTAAAPVTSQIHMGSGEGETAGILASASGAGSHANTAVAGNVALAGHGDDIYVFNSGVFAQGTTGGSADTDIGGNMSFAADGRAAHSYILVRSMTDGSSGSAADVHIHGNVDLDSTGTATSLTRAAVQASGGGTVEIDGHLSAVSDGGDASSAMQVAATGTGHVSVASLNMAIDSAGHGWMDLYTDHSGGLSIGALNVSTSAGSDVTIHVQNANPVGDSTFLGHGDGTANVSIATANIGGAGDAYLFLNTQTFGTINQAASLDRMDLHYQLADHDTTTTIGSAQMTTVNGFVAGRDAVIYNGAVATGANFESLGHFGSLDALNTGLNSALDGTVKYVFAVYDGTEDINHNGVADDHNAGVLAWDDNGTGISSVLILPGVTSLAASDLSVPPPPPTHPA
jgi:hypothetical protein